MLLSRRRLVAGLLSAPFVAQAQAQAQGGRARPGYRGIYASGAPLFDQRRLLPDEIYRRPDASGVYVRLAWSQVEPRRRQYDFTLLDREVQRAVAAGKRISLSLIPGGYAPPWLAGEGIRTLRFNIGRGGANRACIPVEMGVPWDPAYQAAFLEAWGAVAERLRQLPGALEALRIVKLTGINRLTEELRIPAASAADRADVCGVVDDAAQWQAAGYRPQRVVEAFGRISQGLADRFPAQQLALDILERNDFPALDDNGQPSTDPVKPRLIAEAERRFGGRFMLQWNGLGLATPLAETVLQAGRRGTVIGWQSNAFQGVQGAGCNLRRQEAGQPCDSDGFAAILRRGIETGAAYLEVWAADVLRFPDAIRQAEAALAAGAPRPR